MNNVLGLLDANANRAREGIRTAEDFVRFVIRSKTWAERLRRLRHSLTQLFGVHFDAPEVVSARRVKLDSGHPNVQNEGSNSSAGESAFEVALRGLKRAQEAVRVLEEFSRVKSEEAHKRFSRIRFSLYEVEQWLVGGSEATLLLEKAVLYVLVSEAACSLGLKETVVAVIRGGAGVVQLREKDLDDQTFLARAKLVRDICTAEGAVFVVNDRVDVAMAVKADGVHLGQGDLPQAAVRPLVGEQMLIGCSTHGEEEAKKAVQEGADYIAVGAMFQTSTKADTQSTGLSGMKAVLASEVSNPVFAIGGINRDRIELLKSVGVSRVAISSAVISDDDPEGAAREIVDAMRG